MRLKGIFFNKPDMLNTFKTNIESFGVVLKGKSIEKLPKVSNEFDDCFIVNNFDKEIDIVGDSLLNKKIVHFSNRSHLTAPLKPENYNKLKIREVQMYKPRVIWDKTFWYIVYHYESLGLRAVFLPKHLMKVSVDLFGAEFAKKFPSTGLLAIYYALEIIKPRNLWIVGLDFYQSDYLVRRAYNTPIDVMRSKMERTDAPGAVNKWIKDHKDVNFHMVTYFDGFDSEPNLDIL